MEDMRGKLYSNNADSEQLTDNVNHVEIFFEGEGLNVVEAIRLECGASVKIILAYAAAKGGYAESEALLFIEDDAQPISLDLVISEEYPHHRKHHVHRAREVEVAIHYMSRSAERRYPPSTKVDTVLAWALREFGIDASIAPEFELARVDSTEELPGNSHIGTLIHHPCGRLELNLIRGIIPNGGGW